MGALMPVVREKKKERMQSFNGGENSTSEPGVVKIPFASLAQNCDISELGKATQSIGWTEFGDNPTSLTMDMHFSGSAAEDAEGNIAAGNITEASITYDDGKFAKAAQFNGTTSAITVAAAETEISANTMGDFVVTCWVYVESDGENSVGTIFDKVGATNDGYRAWVHSEAADAVKLSFEVYYDNGANNALVVTSTTMSIDVWHKVEFHHEVTGDSLDIYIDGVKASYSTDDAGGTTVDDDDANPLTIGNRAAGDRAFDGAIEELRIYDGTRASIAYEQDKMLGIANYKVGATIDTIVRARNTHLEELDSNQLGWTRLNASDGFTASIADLDTNFVQALDKLFILNGTDNVHSMASDKDITDELNTNTDPPRTTVGAWTQNNRLFLSGSKTDSERDWVWFSDTLAPQTFNRSVNFFKVRSGTGGKVTWLEPFKLNELIIYKSDSIFALNMTGGTPLSDWTLQPVNTDVGCSAGKTVQDVGNDQVFLDAEGQVRLLARTTFDKLRTSIISGPIKSVLDEINIDAIDKCCSEFIDGKYYLSFPTGTNTENNRMVVWDSAASRLAGNPEAGWTTTPINTIYAKCMTKYEFGDNKVRLVHGDGREVNRVYKHTGNTHDGKIISMEVAGPQHDLGSRDTDKLWGPLHVVWDAGEGTTAEMFANIDDTGWISLGTLSLSGGAPQLPIALEFQLGGTNKATGLYHIKQIGRGKTCKIKAQHASYNQTATFIEYELYAEERIPRP